MAVVISSMLKRLRSSDPAGYLIEAVRAYGLERVFGRYYGVYRGIVLDNVDPEKRGRCRVMVPAIGHQNELDVPAGVYALPSMPGLSVGESGQVHGTFMPPDPGDQVWVMFEKGQTTSPVYIGGWIHASASNGEAVRSDNGSLRGIRTKAGHYLVFDDATGVIRVEVGDGQGVATGTKMELREDLIEVTSTSGSVVTVSADTVTLEGKDGSTVTCGSDAVTLRNKTGSSASLNGANVTIDCKGTLKLSATKIELVGTTYMGRGKAFEPAMMGRSFATQYMTHTHVTAIPSTPTSPQTGVPPVIGSGLSSSVFVSE